MVFCFFGMLSSKMGLFLYLHDDVTSWRHVVTSQNMLYLSLLVDVLDIKISFVSMVFRDAELENVIAFVFS